MKFQSSRPLLVIPTHYFRMLNVLNISDTWILVISGNPHSSNLIVCVMKIEIKTIGNLWIYSWELMRYPLNGFHNLLWCNCSSVWWYSESYLSHKSDGIWKRFTNRSLLWIIIYNPRYKLNTISLMMIAISPYWYLENLYLILLKYVEKLTYFVVGLEPPNRCIK